MISPGERALHPPGPARGSRPIFRRTLLGSRPGEYINKPSLNFGARWLRAAASKSRNDLSVDPPNRKRKTEKGAPEKTSASS